GNHRQAVRREHGQQRVHRIRADPGVSLGEDVDPQGQKCAGLGKRERLAHARRVAEDEVALQKAQILPGDAHLRQVAEAGVDAVDRGLARGEPVDQGPRLAQPIPGSGGQGHLGTARCDALQLLEGEGISIEKDAGPRHLEDSLRYGLLFIAPAGPGPASIEEVKWGESCGWSYGARQAAAGRQSYWPRWPTSACSRWSSLRAREGPFSPRPGRRRGPRPTRCGDEPPAWGSRTPWRTRRGRTRTIRHGRSCSSGGPFP